MHDAERILLVEDDATLADVTAFRLELLGYLVETVRNGDEALRAVDRELPHAIILDLAIPGMDGFELTNRLANDSRTSQTPILAFSSDANLENVHRAFHAGVKDFLVTPYDPLVLEHKLEKLLETVRTPK